MTIYTKFKETAEKYPENEALAYLVDGQYRAITYAQLSEKAEQLAAGFADRGLSAKDKIAFMVTNSPEWAIIDLACAKLGIINVPIHTTYNAEYIKYIAEHTQSKWLIIEQEFFKAYKKDLLNLSVDKIIVLDVDETKIEETDKVRSFKKLFDSDVSDKDGDPSRPGRAQDDDSMNDQDVHTIIHTSGTTGMPKGVELTHKNILFNVQGAKEYVDIGPNDRFLSFLPLSHALERTAGYYVPILSGAAIYYAESKLTMKDDIKKARPTVFISVPRVFEKVYDAVQDKARAGSKLKKWLFFRALDYGTKRRKNELLGIDSVIYSILDTIVLKKIRAAMGGRLRFAISGGSALSPDIMQFFEDIGILIIEGYGLTETSPIIAVNKVDNYKFGAVGLPLKGIEVRIAQDKEVQVRGDLVMRGYYDNAQATNDVIDSDGWFSTGDLGEIDSDGFLKITGRKKEIIVLSTGKNVAPVPIEQELETNPYILQAMVFGDNQKHISALIVPDFPQLRIWAKENKKEYSFPDILQTDNVRELYEKQIKSQLNHFPETEQVRDFRLLKDEFTQENDLLTPTLKLKRNKILEKYS